MCSDQAANPVQGFAWSAELRMSRIGSSGVFTSQPTPCRRRWERGCLRPLSPGTGFYLDLARLWWYFY